VTWDRMIILGISIRKAA